MQIEHPLLAQPMQQRQPQNRGRVFALVQPDPSATNAVVEGTLVLFNSWARILFDTGATHSFIASTFVTSLGLCSETMSDGLIVASPMGGEMIAREVCKSCVVRLVGQELTTDLMVLDMVGYDVILGMDWLATHHATVDCYRKRVCIPPADGPCYSFVVVWVHLWHLL